MKVDFPHKRCYVELGIRGTLVTEEKQVFERDKARFDNLKFRGNFQWGSIKNLQFFYPKDQTESSLMMYLGIVGVLSVSLGEVFGDTLIECRKNVSFCTWEYHCSNILFFFRRYHNNNDFRTLYRISIVVFRTYELK